MKDNSDKSFIETFHDKLDMRVEDGISDKQKFDVVNLLCELLGCKIPDSIEKYHHYWLKDYVR